MEGLQAWLHLARTDPSWHSFSEHRPAFPPQGMGGKHGSEMLSPLRPSPWLQNRAVVVQGAQTSPAQVSGREGSPPGPPPLSRNTHQVAPRCCGTPCPRWAPQTVRSGV